MNTEQSEIIEQLYLEMHDMLICYARSALEEDGLAEEAVHETFYIACQKPEQLCGSPNPKGWLVQTLKFTIKNMTIDKQFDCLIYLLFIHIFNYNI